MYEINKKNVKQQLKYLNLSNDEINSFESWVEIDKWINSFPSTLEAQVVIWADKIAYITHDLEDFLRSSSYINLKRTNEKIDAKLSDILCNILHKERIKIAEFELRDLIRTMISNLINTSYNNITPLIRKEFETPLKLTEYRSFSHKNESPKKKYLNSLIINFSDDCRESYYKLRNFLDEYYISSPEVQKSDAKAEVIVEYLFNMFFKNHKLMPLNLRKDIDSQIEDLDDTKQKNDVVARKVACYIATMSDTYAEHTYRNLIGTDMNFML